MGSIPEIRKLAKKRLKKKGAKYFCQDGKALFCYLELPNNRMAFCIYLDYRSEYQFMECDCTFISNIIGESINYITQEKHKVFPGFNGGGLCSKKWERQDVSLNSIEQLVDQIIEEAIEFCSKGDFEPRLNQLLNTIEVPGSHQKWHIAALSSTGNISRLKEILSELETPNRGGFFPYIKTEYVTRAIEYAVNTHNKKIKPFALLSGTRGKAPRAPY